MNLTIAFSEDFSFFLLLTNQHSHFIAHRLHHGRHQRFFVGVFIHANDGVLFLESEHDVHLVPKNRDANHGHPVVEGLHHPVHAAVGYEEAGRRVGYRV